MPGNKFLIADKSKLLKTKLETLSTKLQGALESGDLQTQEEYILESIKILSEFYKSLNEPLLEIEVSRVDDLPDPEVYNKMWQQLLNDLTTIFTELENIESLTVANFNFVTTESNRLTARLKAVSSKVGDYILYSLSPDPNAFFFKDSFNDLSKVDVNSGLLNAEECDVSQAEGIVTLPIDRDRDPTIRVKESPIVNPDSNGVIGNNNEIGVPFNGDLGQILDNNPDTWFEYERVVTRASEDTDSLILDLTINLGEAKVINHIRINPNNFGTKTVIQIDEIETSLEGDVYTSVKDDIPIAGFATDDEENIFSLAPSTSKFAGQGIYTFTPRKAKYVHFILKQNEPYIIVTPAGNRLRYAIGIRDIEIRAQAYRNKGEIISTPFLSESEIRKVLIESNQNPSEFSDLADIQYFVSPDDGSSWHRIQAKELEGISGIESFPEVLEFNGPATNTIVTPVPVKSLRVKAVLSRNDDSFEEGSSSFQKVIRAASEMYQVPATEPFSIELTNPPIINSVIIVDPLFGSRGRPESQYTLGHSIDRLDQRKYRLPFANLPRPIKKVFDGATLKWQTEPVSAAEWLHVEVGGEEWGQTDRKLDEFTSTTFKLYDFDISQGILEFGNGDNTLLPPDNAPVSIFFDAERLFPSGEEDNHVAKLEFTTSNNQQDMTIKRFDMIAEVTETISRKATVVRLANQNLTDTTKIATELLLLSTVDLEVIFINGKDEFSATVVPDASNGFSIDIIRGIVYLANPTPDNRDISLTYKFQPIVTITEDDWGFTATDILRDSVSIKESVWQTITVIDEVVQPTQNTKVFDVSKLSLVPGTLDIDLTFNSAQLIKGDSEFNNIPFVKEVDFKNGLEELGGEVLKTVELIPSPLVPDVNNVAQFDLQENINSNATDFPVSFSNTALFITQEAYQVPPAVPGLAGYLVTNGAFAVSREVSPLDPDYGTVFVNVSTATTIDKNKPGAITYFFTGAIFGNTGLYSVDYNLGRIFTQRAMDPSGLGIGSTAYELSMSFQYVDFRAEYRIARLLDTASYDVDLANQTVTIKDSEVLRRIDTPHQTTSTNPYYLVNYDYVAETREDITELKDLFSPTIKDYALRVLTASRIF